MCFAAVGVQPTKFGWSSSPVAAVKNAANRIRFLDKSNQVFRQMESGFLDKIELGFRIKNN
jgi:hypothetical protein